jgi:phage major head subunit gpT-like protein
MIEARGKWTDLIGGVGIEIGEVFDQGQEEYTPGIGAVLMTTSGDGAQRYVTGKTGIGRLNLFDEGDDLSLGNRHKTFTTKVAYNNYGSGVMVTKNNIMDRDFSEQLDEMRDLSVAANFSQDEAGMQIFNGGFATTEVVNGYKLNLYGDGQPTFSTQHSSTVPGVSVQSNASSTGVPLSVDAVETADVALIEQKTDDALPMAKGGQATLVVPPALRRKAKEIAESEKNPEDANNAINVYRGTFDVAESTFLGTANGGSDTAWFMVVPGRAKMVHEVRQGATLESDVSILNKNVTYTVDARWANGVLDWRRTYGSKGDLAAYSS